jgi:predicted HicB family RNase H-like nuclease
MIFLFEQCFTMRTQMKEKKQLRKSPRMGRPPEGGLKKPHQIAVRIDDDVYQELSNKAKKENKSIASVSRDIIKRSFEI